MSDHSSAICFLYSVYMERFVLVPSSRIFLAGRQEDPTTRKMLAPLKLLSLGRSVLILVLGTKLTKLVSP